jgi:ribulose bisphosphate carboxylase small subunit
MEKAKGSQAAQIRYCLKEGDIRYQTGIEEKEKRKETREGTAFWSRTLDNAKTMNMQTFKNAHLNEWIPTRQVIERVMMEVQGTRAKRWNGNQELRSSGFGD